MKRCRQPGCMLPPPVCLTPGLKPHHALRLFVQKQTSETSTNESQMRILVDISAVSRWRLSVCDVSFCITHWCDTEDSVCLKLTRCYLLPSAVQPQRPAAVALLNTARFSTTVCFSPRSCRRSRNHQPGAKSSVAAAHFSFSETDFYPHSHAHTNTHLPPFLLHTFISLSCHVINNPAGCRFTSVKMLQC